MRPTPCKRVRRYRCSRLRSDTSSMVARDQARDVRGHRSASPDRGRGDPLRRPARQSTSRAWACERCVEPRRRDCGPGVGHSRRARDPSWAGARRSRSGHRRLARRAHAAHAVGGIHHARAGLGVRDPVGVDRGIRSRREDDHLRTREGAVRVARGPEHSHARGLQARWRHLENAQDLARRRDCARGAVRCDRSPAWNLCGSACRLRRASE